MTDKEFKRLNRAQLIDIIYQLQLQNDQLNAEKKALADELADKRIRLSSAGNIADAAVAIHNVMQAAQDAASHYLEEIRMMREDTQRECQRLLESAKAEAEAILAQAREGKALVDPTLEAIIREFL